MNRQKTRTKLRRWIAVPQNDMKEQISMYTLLTLNTPTVPPPQSVAIKLLSDILPNAISEQSAWSFVKGQPDSYDKLILQHLADSAKEYNLTLRSNGYSETLVRNNIAVVNPIIQTAVIPEPEYQNIPLTLNTTVPSGSAPIVAEVYGEWIDTVFLGLGDATVNSSWEQLAELSKDMLKQIRNAILRMASLGNWTEERMVLAAANKNGKVALFEQEQKAYLLIGFPKLAYYCNGADTLAKDDSNSVPCELSESDFKLMENRVALSKLLQQGLKSMFGMESFGGSRNELKEKLRENLQFRYAEQEFSPCQIVREKQSAAFGGALFSEMRYCLFDASEVLASIHQSVERPARDLRKRGAGHFAPVEEA